MSQTKKRSLFEAFINVLVGFAIAMTSQYYIYKYYGLELDLETNIVITIWFTGISIARSYVIRRIMNRFDN